MNFNCPHCHQTDLAQKISKIYYSGISHSQDADSHFDFDSNGTISINISVKIQLSEQGQAYLQQKFVPPAKPKVPTEEYLKYTVAIAVVPFAFMMISGELAGSMAHLVFPGFPLAAIILFIVYLCRLALELIILKRPRVTYQQRLKKWYRDCLIWERLYYCHRCDIVYDPERPEIVSSVHNLKKFYR